MKQNNFLSSLTRRTDKTHRSLFQKLVGYGWRVVSINRTEIWNG